MTKEEYQRLLQSDYWKGFSYSIIKERNFTCEDCGAQFPGERNKLQVHHLVYRDINPWSYAPEEMLVLCRKCHAKRHGINLNEEQNNSSTHDNTEYSSNSYYATNEQNEHYQKEYSSNDDFSRQPISYGKIIKKILIGAAILFVLIICISKCIQDIKTENTTDDFEETDNESVVTTKKHKKHKKSHKQKSSSPQKEMEEDTEEDTFEEIPDDEEVINNVETSEAQSSSLREKSTLDLLEERNHASVVKRAKEAGVSTEGSTMDILERINHASVVKRAKEAGVSTEGSTMDILERINRKQLEKH